MFDENGVTTSELYNSTRYDTPRGEINLVSRDYEPKLDLLVNYLESRDLHTTILYRELEKYFIKDINYEKIKFSEFLTHLAQTESLKDNKTIFSQIMDFLDYASEENKLHKDQKARYVSFLQNNLFEKNKDAIDDSVLKKHEKLDYSQYEHNNFKKEGVDNKVISALESNGGAIYLNSEGKICCKLSQDDTLKAYSKRQAEIILSTHLQLRIKITEEFVDEEPTNIEDEKTSSKKKTDNTTKISIHELLLVNEEKFNPKALKEYFQEDGIYYRNKFKPTSYMKLNDRENRHPKTILDLLFHIVNYNSEKYEYLLNHLAYFFQYLQKAQTAIALIGEQGAGKGILFEEIISELFGRKYCMIINNESISSRYKGQIIKDKLFYNFDEINLRTSQKNEAFLKAVITNPFISLEEKNVTMSKEVELFGQCFFSSNHMTALSIEPNDRRFTVIKTADNLVNSNFLNYGSYNKLIIVIKQDLEEFAMFLKNYNVDTPFPHTQTSNPRIKIQY